MRHKGLRSVGTFAPGSCSRYVTLACRTLLLKVVLVTKRCLIQKQQESLAHSFEGLSLPEDALLVYEELDATFLQILKEQNLSWFGKLGASGPTDDSLPILDASVKPYREMLQHSQISVFDFRIYVFARQAALLGALGRITEVAKRGQWFVASLARRLRESEVSLQRRTNCFGRGNRLQMDGH